MSIPVVDISSVDHGLEGSSVVQQVHTAFITVGFVFITNHGIPRELIDRAFDEATKFFTLPLENKLNYGRTPNSQNNGYVSLEEERNSVNPSNSGDLKEYFDVTAIEDCYYPDKEVPMFQPTVRELFLLSSQLALKLLEIIGHSLKLEEPELLVKAHQDMGKGAGFSLTTMRLLYYPPLPPDSEIKPGQLRCGEHVDYGSITLLFQDPLGGLQVKSKDGDYTNVPYRSDAVLVNLGAMAQKWTRNVYLATPHRVLLPVEEAEKKSVRQSLAFFVHPDNQVVLQDMNGHKYPPITVEEDGVCLWF